MDFGRKTKGLIPMISILAVKGKNWELVILFLYGTYFGPNNQFFFSKDLTQLIAEVLCSFFGKLSLYHKQNPVIVYPLGKVESLWF